MGGALHDGIRVEARDPVRAASGTGSFSPVREQEAPAPPDGASCPAGDAADARVRRLR
ncbi:hypothetical protein GCM10010446_17930 [Streptomyces enissocaesilis]|uniref:Uncharacterized protein n=1 Tax=Streptomyces enissocaesilis TaxID=332589 RepID=A0ABN3X333_9ACTN